MSSPETTPGRSRARRVLLSLVGVGLATAGACLAACSLNPQPLPPGDDLGFGGSSDAGSVGVFAPKDAGSPPESEDPRGDSGVGISDEGGAGSPDAGGPLDAGASDAATPDAGDAGDAGDGG